MKAVLTLVLVLFATAITMAQKPKNDGKMDLDKVDAVLAVGHGRSNDLKEASAHTRNKVARLYRFKDSRVKKELAFSTKRQKSKLA